jgi:hypothetical protein
MRRLLLLCVLCAIFAAEAAVYRCEVDRRPVYTDRPCAAGSAPHDLPVISVLPSPGEADLVADHDARRERHLKAKTQEDAKWLKDHRKRKVTDERMSAAAVDHKVLKDMSADQVRRALGSPDEVKRKDGVERWTYVDGKQRRTVVLKNGRVSSAGGPKGK